MNWRKSSRSADQGNCVEAASFRKSTHSMNHGDCVEAGNEAGAVAVRDSKDRDAGPVLTFGPATWSAFTAALRETP